MDRDERNKYQREWRAGTHEQKYQKTGITAEAGSAEYHRQYKALRGSGLSERDKAYQEVADECREHNWPNLADFIETHCIGKKR